ncbi:phytoene desaturase family protein [Thermocrinis sp.]
MEVLDYAVVGAGIGGVLASALLTKLGRSVALFESLSYLGGCAGTFKKNGFSYNVGATTITGLEDPMPLWRIAEFLETSLPVRELPLSMQVLVKEKRINLWWDSERLLDDLNKNFRGSANHELIDTLRKSHLELWRTLWKFLPFRGYTDLVRFFLRHPTQSLRQLFWHFRSGQSFKEYINGYEDYRLFLDYISLITSQAFLRDVSYSVAVMGLSYPINKTYYAFGGMSNFMESLAKDVDPIYRKTTVFKVKKAGGHFLLETSKGEFRAKRVILNTTVWNLEDLVEVESVKNFSRRAKRTYSKAWSAITLYAKVKKENVKDTPSHVLILDDEPLPFGGTKELFLSFSLPEDRLMSSEDELSLTVSTHTLPSYWENLTEEEYSQRTHTLKEEILERIYKRLPSLKGGIREPFIGTPKTFERYTKRYKGLVGGIPIVREYFPFHYPLPFTPAEGLYVVGDTIFPGQGILGVSVGVLNLLMAIEEEFRKCWSYA